MDVRVIVCGACRTILAYLNMDEYFDQRCELLAETHRSICTATEEEYEQARYDIKFRQITKGLEL